MEIVRRLKVPTGDILVVKGEKGLLECVSLGDYGQDKNLKCDAIGLTQAPSDVRHTDLLPLEEKWVITISSQYGCSMGCSMCDVPKVGPGYNTSVADMVGQVNLAMSIHPEVTYSDRLNLHFARMGEPSFNFNVLETVTWLKGRLGPFELHPVVSTMMPKRNMRLKEFVREWMSVKNHTMSGEAGLQLSINSTSEIERHRIFGGNALTLHDISHVMSGFKPKGRKITLNFAVAGWEIDPEKLLQYFDPDHYVVKLTPMHLTNTARDNGLETPGDVVDFYAYLDHEEALKKAGYDVLVFVASKEEDDGLITCGNSILSGSLPRCNYEEVEV